MTEALSRAYSVPASAAPLWWVVFPNERPKGLDRCISVQAKSERAARQVIRSHGHSDLAKKAKITRQN